MNILFTCAGRRNYLLQFCREALAGRGQVFAADSLPTAPAMMEADRAFVVPRVDDPTYFDVITALAVEHDARLLISLNDLELPYLAREKARLRALGILPVVSEPWVIDTCFDKYRTARTLAEIGLAAPKTYLTLAEARAALAAGELSYPLVVKPRWGTGSIGLEFPQDARELELAHALVSLRLSRTIIADVSAADPARNVLIQERLPGQEYGLDIVNDLDGNHVTTFVKQKLAMRAGETDKAETVDAPALRVLGARIAAHLRHVGNLDCDVFLTPDGPVVLEMNARFGGGYPFSHIAGANLPAALLAWHAGETPDPAWLRVTSGIIAAKCDRLVARTHVELGW
ncbi:MAG TPA: ATP-grasp domain-containing protein [Armatimonadota bacterium]|nr:ATP-grasp domain-containing protein [Armatimonadota bacterium]